MVPLRFRINQNNCNDVRNKSCIQIFHAPKSKKRSFNFDSTTSRIQRLKQIYHTKQNPKKKCFSTTKNKNNSEKKHKQTRFIESQSSRIHRLRFLRILDCSLADPILEPIRPRFPSTSNINNVNSLTPSTRSYSERIRFHDILHNHLEYDTTNENDKRRIRQQNQTIDLSEIKGLDLNCPNVKT